MNHSLLHQLRHMPHPLHQAELLDNYSSLNQLRHIFRTSKHHHRVSSKVSEICLRTRHSR